MNAEEKRLAESNARTKHWKRWGSVSERTSVGHSTRRLFRRRFGVGLLSARPRAFACVPLERRRYRRHQRIRHQRICFSVALVERQRSQFFKERLFGLTGSEGNHGEDVKELYYYLDSTPTHSYMKISVQVSSGGVSVCATDRSRTGYRSKSWRASSS